MNKKYTKKNISILMSLLLILTFVSCTKIDKETVLSPNVNEDIQEEENQVKLILEEAHSYLKSNDFDSAKSTYEKAISMDKTNKDIYLEISSNYLAINRFDDALYFIQLSNNYNNNINATENMEFISNNIEPYIQTNRFTKDLYKGDNFTLPSELTTKINNEDISIPVTWNTNIVDTSITGTFYFVGTNKEYSREFNATINVLPPVIVEEPSTILDEEHAYVKNIYKSNGKTYIDVDLIEFLRGDNALSAALEENPSSVWTNENGSQFIPNSYYIRDKVHNIVTYEVSDNTTFNLTEYLLNESYGADVLDPVAISYDKFESYIKSHTTTFDDHLTSGIAPRQLLFLIKLKNNIVSDISFLYTP